jgi:tRNA(His) 5'-end guanylyltransferase
MEATSLETRMRAFEAAQDPLVPPGGHIVARLDGRGFTRLTKHTLDLERPFDLRFRDAMLSTAEALMRTGPQVAYAYVQSDEISLLLSDGPRAFGARLTKLCSILAGVASAEFSLRMGTAAAFDCRIVSFPASSDVTDYFLWRQSDARRNALGAHCYWALRGLGKTSDEATDGLRGLGSKDRLSLLGALGRNLDARPLWEQRGVGLCFRMLEKLGVDPRSGAKTVALRQTIQRDAELPVGDSYATYVRERIASGKCQ